MQSAYTFSLSLYLSSSSTVIAKTSVTVYRNTPPSPGTLSVTPVTAGIEMDTVFTIAAELWDDEDLPLSYKFTYQTSSSQAHTVLQAKALSYTLSTQLPAGIDDGTGIHDFIAFVFYLFVEMKDSSHHNLICSSHFSGLCMLPITVVVFDSLDNDNGVTRSIEVKEETLTISTLNSALTTTSSSTSSVSNLINVMSSVLTVLPRLNVENDADLTSLVQTIVTALETFVDMSMLTLNNIEVITTSISQLPSDGAVYPSETQSSLIDIGSSVVTSSLDSMMYDDTGGLFSIVDILVKSSSSLSASSPTRRRLAEGEGLYDIDGVEYFFSSISIVYANDMSLGQTPLTYLDSSAYYVFAYPLTFQSYQLVVGNYSLIDYEDIGYGNRVSGTYYASSLSTYTKLVRTQINDLTLCPAVDYGPIYECVFNVTSNFLLPQNFDQEVYTYSNTTTCEKGKEEVHPFTCPDGSTVYANCTGAESMIMFSCVTRYTPRCDIVASNNSSFLVSTACATKQYNDSHITCECSMRSDRGPVSPLRVFWLWWST